MERTAREEIQFALGALDSQREYIAKTGISIPTILLAQNQSATKALNRALAKLETEATDAGRASIKTGGPILGDDNETKVKP